MDLVSIFVGKFAEIVRFGSLMMPKISPDPRREIKGHQGANKDINLSSSKNGKKQDCEAF